MRLGKQFSREDLKAILDSYKKTHNKLRNDAEAIALDDPVARNELMADAEVAAIISAVSGMIAMNNLALEQQLADLGILPKK